jgi:hypothetical protein
MVNLSYKASYCLSLIKYLSPPTHKDTPDSTFPVQTLQEKALFAQKPVFFSR